MGYRPNNFWRQKVRGADSKWEAKLRDGVLKEAIHHDKVIPYVIEHTYEPDFVIGNLIIEAKGRFMDASEASKYLWIRKSLQKGQELVFLFYKATTSMPHAKMRKDGTKMTHGEWATLHKFRWFTEETIGEIL